MNPADDLEACALRGKEAAIAFVAAKIRDAFATWDDLPDNGPVAIDVTVDMLAH